MEKMGPKKTLKHPYGPSAKEVTAVDVPPMNFLMIDGGGDPGGSESYGNAVGALHAVSYALKFMVKKGEAAVDYAVMPLEGLWWADDAAGFDLQDRDAWEWTAMIMQPEYVTDELFEEARTRVGEKKDPPALPHVRFGSFHKGPAAHIMHASPYAKEGPAVARTHRFIEERGHRRGGKHHEIYPSEGTDHAGGAEDHLVRQPFG